MPDGYFTDEDGFCWVIREGSEDFLAGMGHEGHLWPIVASLVPPEGVFLDVGAHVGHYAIRMAPRCVEVYAVEPNPGTIDALALNCELNNVNNVRIIPVGASDHAGNVGLVNPHASIDGGSMRIEGSGDIAVRRLDEELPNLTRLDLVKLDVEGHDIEALKGMHGLIVRFRPRLFIESHDRLYPGRGIEEGLQRFLADYYYTRELIYQNPDVEYWLFSPVEDETIEPITSA